MLKRPGASFRHASGALWLAVLVSVVLTWMGAFGYTAWRMRQTAIQESLEVTRLVALSLEDSLTQALQSAELSVQTLQAQYVSHPAGGVAFNARLQDTARNMPFIRSMSLADGDGRVLFSSDLGNLRAATEPAQAYPMVEMPLGRARIGVPHHGRDWARLASAPGSAAPAPDPSGPGFVPVYLSWSHDGKPRWWVVTLNVDHFQTQARLLSGHRELDVLWVRYDGLPLWDGGMGPGLRAARSHKLAQWLADQDISTLSIPPEPDMAASLLSYRASSSYPVAVSVWQPTDRVLAQWAQESRARALELSPVLVLLVLVAWGMLKYHGKLQAKQAELDEERLRDQRVVQSSSDGILVTDAEGRILSVNPAFEKISGYRSEQVLGRNPRLLGAGLEERGFFDSVWQHILADGRWSGELVNRRPSGEAYTALVTINAIRDASGQLTQFAGVMTDVTAQRAMQAALRESEERMSLALENGGLGAWDWVVASGRIVVSPRWCEMLGMPVQAVVQAQEWTQRLHPDDRELVWGCFQAHLSEQSPQFSCEYRLRHASGQWVWVMSVGRIIERDHEHKAVRMVGTHLDVSERKAALDAQQLAASVFSHAQEAIMITDPSGVLIDVNQAFLAITGYQRDEVIGCNASMLGSGRQDKAFYQAMWRSLDTYGRWAGEIWNRRKSGEVFAELLTISAVKDVHGAVLRYVALFSDITRQKEHEAQLERMAHFDALTGLPNRVLLTDRLRQAMAQTERRGDTLAVVFLDLDGFKAVNDSHGHAAGDHLLVALAVRMRQALREGDTLARLGGDEFVAVLAELSDPRDSLPVLERMLAAVAAPVTSDSYPPLEVSASLGISFYPQPGEVGADQLLRQADHAMYQAKLRGKNRYFAFNGEQALECLRPGVSSLE